MQQLFAAIFLLLIATPQGIAQVKSTVENSTAAKVMKVIDGDTVDVESKDSTYRIRLFGIDAPEKGQDFFEESKQLLESLVLGKEVLLTRMGNDRFSREVAVITRKVDKLNINYQMVRKGMAWHFTRYSSDPELARLEAAAREKEIGIWSLFHYLEPWEYRKNQ